MADELQSGQISPAARTDLYGSFHGGSATAPRSMQPSPVRPHGGGMLVSMFKIPHLTEPGLLDVPFHFEVPPLDGITRSYGFDFSTYQTLRNGEMTSPQGRRLTSITFQAIFMSYSTGWTYTIGGYDWDQSPINPPNPIEATRKLIRIMESGTPFGLSAHNHPLYRSADISMGPQHGNAAVLTTLDVEERAGEPDSRYANVTFQEYRDPQLHRRRKGRKDATRGRKVPATVVVDLKGTAGVRDGIRDADNGVVIKNATLRKLAKHFYGEQSMWRDIAKANDIKNFTGGRDLGELVKRRKDKTMKIHIPKISMVAEWTVGHSTVDPDFGD